MREKIPTCMPQVFYKYRSLEYKDKSLEADHYRRRMISNICNDEIYLASPKDFNDPLDCAPIIDSDVSIENLQSLIFQLTKVRRTPPEQFLTKARSDDEVKLIYCDYVTAILMEKIKCGVFSLTTNCVSPLMWSHYGEQHKGLCIGYKIKTNEGNFHRDVNIQKVQYGGNRTIHASDVQKFIWMVNGLHDEVKNKVLL